DPQWETRYRHYDEALDAAIEQAVAIAPDAVRSASQATLAADVALDAIELRAFELTKAGRRAEATALFDARYEELKLSYARGMDELTTGLGAEIGHRLDAHRRTMFATLCVTAIGLVFLVLLWLRMLTSIRRYIGDRRDAEDELRKAHATLETRVAERTREVAASREQYRFLVENIDAVPFEWDPATRRMIYLAPQATALFGGTIEELQGAGFLARAVHADDRDQLARRIEGVIAGVNAGARGGTLDCAMVHAERGVVHVRIFLAARPNAQTAYGVMLDITQQTQLESELRQAHKLESVGRLAASIAHEINTPIQFVRDSVQFVHDAMPDVTGVLDHHRRSTERAAAGEPAQDLALAAQAAEVDADMAYLSTQLPEALDLALDGLTRVATIVRSMKVFAHPRKERSEIDLNESITSTLTIARGEYKYVADLETEFAELPPVSCYAGELNQVILNLVTNAAHAIGDVVAGTAERGRIMVATRRDGDDVVISVGDTGGGIPPAIGARIFEPFFTTKDVGKGTGQGLSHAHAVVVDRHRGSLTFDTAVGTGTTFHIRIPIGGDSAELAA
ncbi:MAG TPA: ATP-binding protein, partial [Kofleriaceae bacterium]|nr:ATP-binding protein [Kofleriaceae bacterium]